MTKPEIAELYARYAQYYDDGRAEEFGLLFTTTATFIRAPGAEPVTGRHAIADLVTAAGTPTGIRHLVSSVIVDSGLGEVAYGAAYVQVLAVDEDAVRLVTLGRYTDEFHYEDGAWRFHAHQYEPFTGAVLRGAILAGDA
ncbi:nuclear transport factor 2 family protein [Saccharopolyspora sp. ASAGF58]|uniref:nuclear transport factor 2 family protein n=1 Tax=Saccharopolyspora sp. ASAGF58 TaxID=2719023 RepID=UPI0014402138|nr:nuclear transport factor 2 family protein [Saccharopolyspora sp. ASAGF58]QIZ37736.1 nuclear transport factor 2 family protein [Saccharopolyspora sp. ASAGF58]